MNQWRTIINRILSIPCILDDKGTTVNPRILTMSDDAEEYFYEWYNGIIDAVNAIEDDANVESRKMKLNGHVARLALLFQVMKWATDSGDMQYIEWDSVESAIRMIDYYEETYRRIQETIVINSIGETKEVWLSYWEIGLLPGMLLLLVEKSICPDVPSIMRLTNCVDFSTSNRKTSAWSLSQTYDRKH